MQDQLLNIEVYRILDEQGLLNEQQKEHYEKFEACEYKGTFINCQPKCCINCKTPEQPVKE